MDCRRACRETATGGLLERTAVNRRGNDGAVARSDPSMVHMAAGRPWRTLHVPCRLPDSSYARTTNSRCGALAQMLPYQALKPR